MVTDFPNANLALWVYQRLAPGQFKRLSRKLWWAWYRGDAALKPDASGLVHTAAFWMYVENRRAVGIGRIELLRSKVDPRGIRTEEISNEESFAWMAMASDKKKQSIGPVVNAAGRFGVGQFKWKPTKEDARELCRAINERAGTELLIPTGRT